MILFGSWISSEYKTAEKCWFLFLSFDTNKQPSAVCRGNLISNYEQTKQTKLFDHSNIEIGNFYCIYFIIGHFCLNNKSIIMKWLLFIHIPSVILYSDANPHQVWKSGMFLLSFNSENSIHIRRYPWTPVAQYGRHWLEVSGGWSDED